MGKLGIPSILVDCSVFKLFDTAGSEIFLHFEIYEI